MTKKIVGLVSCIMVISVVSCVKIGNTEIDLWPFGSKNKFPTMEKLDAQYQARWNIPNYASARNADTAVYLTAEERKIYYYLNIVRLNPKLFAATYATGYKGANGFSNPDKFDENEKSLIAELNLLDSLQLLKPSRDLFGYAECQAKGVVNNNLKGLDEHDRSKTGCPAPANYSENAYGFAKISPLDVVMGWLNDAGNVYGPSQLGHRENCLDPSIRLVGVSLINYNQKSQTAIADFSF